MAVRPEFPRSFSKNKKGCGWDWVLAAAVAAVLLAPWPGHAGTITVVNLPATGTDAATGISTTNTYLCCVDFGSSANSPGSINGVSFIHPNLGNQIVNTTNGVDVNFDFSGRQVKHPAL